MLYCSSIGGSSLSPPNSRRNARRREGALQGLASTKLGFPGYLFGVGDDYIDGMNGTDLLAEFRATRAEAAFSELVRRYTNLVYSIAKRRVADVTLAQEVTQIVFIRLAKAPPKLDSEAQLLGWLHRTTVHVSIDLWRSETRRRAREQHAVAMQTDRTEEVAWNEMTPVLDEALDGLNEADRQAILLRFFEQKTMADLGRAFGVTEDAAKMRVSRALERLRTQLGGLGATCSAALLGTLLFERSVEAAPTGLGAHFGSHQDLGAGWPGRRSCQPAVGKRPG